MEQKNKGAMMVEATIYIPIVLCIVMALIYLALFNMQEYMMMYEAQRVAAVVSRELAYPGYDQFGMGQNNEIDFSWGMGSTPSSSQVDGYYKKYHEKLSFMYREVSSIAHALGIGKINTGEYSTRFADAVRNSTLIALGTISNPEIDVKSGFLGSGVTVTFTHSIPIPGVLQYLGYDEGTTLRVAAYTYSVNPSSFVRNVDLASDLADYICKKLGIDGKYNGFKAQFDKVIKIIF